ATSAGPAHLSTPPRLGLASAARARSERTAAPPGAGCLSDHAVSAAPAVVPAAVLRKRLRSTLSPGRICFISRALLVVGARTPYTGSIRSSTAPALRRAGEGRWQGEARERPKKAGGTVPSR